MNNDTGNDTDHMNFDDHEWSRDLQAEAWAIGLGFAVIEIALSVIGFFRSRYGKIAAVIYITCAIACGGLYVLYTETRDENTLLRAQIEELQSERAIDLNGIRNALAVRMKVWIADRNAEFVQEHEQLVEENRSLRQRLFHEQVRADGLEADYDYEYRSREYSDQINGYVPTGADPWLMDEHGEICRTSETGGMEGHCFF